MISVFILYSLTMLNFLNFQFLKANGCMLWCISIRHKAKCLFNHLSIPAAAPLLLVQSTVSGESSYNPVMQPFYANDGGSGGGGGGGFFLACEDFRRLFDCSFLACVFFFFFLSWD